MWVHKPSGSGASVNPSGSSTTGTTRLSRLGYSSNTQRPVDPVRSPLREVLPVEGAQVVYLHTRQPDGEYNSSSRGTVRGFVPVANRTTAALHQPECGGSRQGAGSPSPAVATRTAPCLSRRPPSDGAAIFTKSARLQQLASAAKRDSGAETSSPTAQLPNLLDTACPRNTRQAQSLNDTTGKTPPPPSLLPLGAAAITSVVVTEDSSTTASSTIPSSRGNVALRAARTTKPASCALTGNLGAPAPSPPCTAAIPLTTDDVLALAPHVEEPTSVPEDPSGDQAGSPDPPYGVSQSASRLPGTIDTEGAARMRDLESDLDIVRTIYPDVELDKIRHLLLDTARTEASGNLERCNDLNTLRDRCSQLEAKLRQQRNNLGALRGEYRGICKRTETSQEEHFKVEVLLRKTVAQEEQQISLLLKEKAEKQRQVQSLAQKNEQLTHALQKERERALRLEDAMNRCAGQMASAISSIVENEVRRHRRRRGAAAVDWDTTMSPNLLIESGASRAASAPKVRTCDLRPSFGNSARLPMSSSPDTCRQGRSAPCRSPERDRLEVHCYEHLDDVPPVPPGSDRSIAIPHALEGSDPTGTRPRHWSEIRPALLCGQQCLVDNSTDTFPESELLPPQSFAQQRPPSGDFASTISTVLHLLSSLESTAAAAPSAAAFPQCCPCSQGRSFPQDGQGTNVAPPTWLGWRTKAPADQCPNCCCCSSSSSSRPYSDSVRGDHFEFLKADEVHAEKSSCKCGRGHTSPEVSHVQPRLRLESEAAQSSGAAQPPESPALHHSATTSVRTAHLRRAASTEPAGAFQCGTIRRANQSLEHQQRRQVHDDAREARVQRQRSRGRPASALEPGGTNDTVAWAPRAPAKSTSSNGKHLTNRGNSNSNTRGRTPWCNQRQ